MEKMFYTQKQQPIPSLSADEFISLKNIASKNGFFKCIKHEKYVLSGAVTLTTTDKRVLPLQVSTALHTPHRNTRATPKSNIATRERKNDCSPG